MCIRMNACHEFSSLKSKTRAASRSVLHTTSTCKPGPCSPSTSARTVKPGAFIIVSTVSARPASDDTPFRRGLARRGLPARRARRQCWLLELRRELQSALGATTRSCKRARRGRCSWRPVVKQPRVGAMHSVVAATNTSSSRRAPSVAVAYRRTDRAAATTNVTCNWSSASKKRIASDETDNWDAADDRRIKRLT